MKTYLRVEDGRVVEVIRTEPVDGIDYPIEARYHPDFVALLVEAPEGQEVGEGFVQNPDGSFSAPEANEEPAP